MKDNEKIKDFNEDLKVNEEDEKEETEIEEENLKNKLKLIYEKINEKNIILIFILLIVSIFFISAFITSSINGKDKAFCEFSKGIIKKDVKKIKKYIVFSDPNIEITEDDIIKFLDYTDTHSYYKQELLKSLHVQTRKNYKSDTNYVFNFKKVGKRMLIFDKYKIEMKPYYIVVDNKYKDINIYLNGEEIPMIKSDEYAIKYGPVISGMHNLEISYIDKYKKVGKIKNLEGFSVYNQELSIDIE